MRSKLAEHGVRVGCVTLTTIREISLPIVNMESRIRFAIGCAERVRDAEFIRWSDDWLCGIRTLKAVSETATTAADWTAEQWAARRRWRGWWGG